MSVRGLGAVHIWTAADGQTFTLGDRTVHPRAIITKIVGRHSKPEGEDNRDPRVNALGEIPRLSMLRGKTESWELTLDADSLVEQSAIRDAFVNAFADQREGTMEIASHPNYQDGPYTFKARCISADVPDEQATNPNRPWSRKATLVLRLSDPRYYEQYERVATAVGMAPTGGITFPNTLPTPVPASVQLPGSVMVDAGGAPLDPVVEFTGPVISPLLISDTLQRRIYMPVFVLRENQTAVVDFANRTVMLDGHSVRDFVDWTSSGWFDAEVWGLRRGVNRLRYRGIAVGAAARMTVRWQKASFG